MMEYFQVVASSRLWIQLRAGAGRWSASEVRVECGQTAVCFIQFVHSRMHCCTFWLHKSPGITFLSTYLSK